MIAAAEGNPLLAVESARVIAAGGEGPPPNLRTAVRATCGLLPAHAQMLINLLAAAGRPLASAELDGLRVPDLGLAEEAARARTAAPVEEVWKLLHDPARFPEWWAGVETVATGADGHYTMWPAGYPDFPMAQHLGADAADGRVTISCLVSDLMFRWRLRADGESTDIDVEAELPDREAHRLHDQRRILQRSLAALATLAAEAGS